MSQMFTKLPRQERPRGVGGRREASALRWRATLVGRAPMGSAAQSGNCWSSRKVSAAMLRARL